MDSEPPSSRLYAEALIDYGLQEGDDESFRRGMEMVNLEDTYKILNRYLNGTRDFELYNLKSLGGQMAKSS